MTWIVRNTLRGTLELHGFLDNEQPIRINGGELFDLDSICNDRQYIESSRQIETAFREGYLLTESKDESAVCDEIVEDEQLSPWQYAMQTQINRQTQNIEVITAMMKNVVDQLQKNNREALNENRLVQLMKTEIQAQIKLMMRSMPAGSTHTPHPNNAATQQQKEAKNKARLFERVADSMDVQFNPQKIVGVKTIVDKKQNTSNMVDLLSNLEI